MKYDCERIYTAVDFCIVRVGSFIVLLSKFGFSFSGTREDWDKCLEDLSYANNVIQHEWQSKGLPTNPQDSPGHDKLVAAAVKCARAGMLGWFE